jgi:hypothetical protein
MKGDGEAPSKPGCERTRHLNTRSVVSQQRVLTELSSNPEQFSIISDMPTADDCLSLECDVIGYAPSSLRL